MSKYSSKTVFTHSKWANEQTLKTDLHIIYNVSTNKDYHCVKCLL